MTDSSEKDKVIRQIYYDADSGFGSITETYKASKKVLNSITYDDVKDFLSRQKVRQFKGYRGFNSYVAKEPLQEIQIDIADFTRSAEENGGIRYLFVAIDIFTKICHAVPIKDKKTPESIRAFKEVLEKIGIPENIYHDNEGSWSTTGFIKLLNQHKINQIITTAPPPFAERMVQTIKNMIHIRLEGLEINKEKWVDILPSVLKKYNNTEHSTINMKPNEAKDKKNHFEVWLNIHNKSNFARKYPPLKVGDSVRVYIKKKTGFTKGYDPKFSKEIYKVLFYKDKQYLVNNNTRKLYSRHELLKVNAAEGKDD